MTREREKSSAKGREGERWPRRKKDLQQRGENTHTPKTSCNRKEREREKVIAKERERVPKQH